MANGQSQYQLERVMFSADRLPELDAVNGGVLLDLKGSVAELNIYENIELPFLTGSIAIVDDTKFRSSMEIKGSERIEIGIKASDNSDIIVKKFMVTGLAKNVSVNERTDVHVLTLMEEHGFLSAINKISESYTGLPEEIVKNLLKSHLNKEMVFYSNLAQQSVMRVNIPYWNPLQATDWLRDRMAFSNGSPYFLYATLRDDDIHLDDLDTLMSATSWNEDMPYTYAQGAHNTDEVSPETQQRELFHVKGYRASSIESTLRLAQAGAIGSDFQVRDLTSGSTLESTFHNSNTTLNEFISSVDPEADLGASIGYDDSLEIGPTENLIKNIADYPSKVFSSVVATRQFFVEEGNNRPVMAGYHDENQQEMAYKLKIKSASLRAILMNNVFTITVPGQPYIIDEHGVGSNIMLNYAAATQNDESLANDGGLDKGRSGKFLIYKARHQFSEGIYDVHMDIVKLTDKIQ